MQLPNFALTRLNKCFLLNKNSVTRGVSEKTDPSKKKSLVVSATNILKSRYHRFRKQTYPSPHQHSVVISSALHMHISENDCLGAIAVKDKTSEARKLSNTLATKKGVKILKTMKVTV